MLLGRNSLALEFKQAQFVILVNVTIQFLMLPYVSVYVHLMGNVLFCHTHKGWLTPDATSWLFSQITALAAHGNMLLMLTTRDHSLRAC